MSNDKVIINFYEDHIKSLNGMLSDIYTIDQPKSENKEGKVDVVEKLKWLYSAEKVYNVIENGVGEGEVYEKYRSYLDHVRESIKIFEKEKEKIDKERASDISNINILLESFERQLESN